MTTAARATDDRLVLRLLGATTLTRGERAPVSRVLGAPKRFGVLVYLAIAEPMGFQRRDTLLALFWPDLPQHGARAALRNTLHLLRRDLGDDVIVRRGDEEIAIARELLDCDVLHFRAALRSGQLERALALYTGALLPGFFVPNADVDLEEWLDGERRRLRRDAAGAALELSRRAHAIADASAALRWAHRGREISPDEPEVERWLAALERGPGATAPRHDAAADERTPVVSAGPADPRTIAVLPFLNLSPGPDTDYFADGIIDELIGLLARVPPLRVAARASSFAFRHSGAAIPEIARRLGVGTVVEGSVRREGTQIRVGVRVADGATGFQRWSGTFEREIGSVFALQDEMAAAIAAAVSVHASNGNATALETRQAPTGDLAAYELYLEGIYQLQQRGIGPLRASITLFQRALALDGQFARAHAALASAWHALTFWSPDEQATSGRHAETAAERAVALDDSLAEAHAVLANRMIARRAWADADERFRHAIALAPNHPQASHWYADFLQQTGRIRESIVHARRALELDPVSPVRNIVLAVSLLYAGELDEAFTRRDAAYRLGLAQDGFLPLAFAMDDPSAEGLIGDLLGIAVEDDGALPSSVRNALRIDIRDARVGGDELGSVLLEQSLPVHQRFLLAVLAGDGPRALQLGGTLAREASWFMSGFWLERARPVRSLPAFETLMREVGLEGYWTSEEA